VPYGPPYDAAPPRGRLLAVSVPTRGIGWAIGTIALFAALAVGRGTAADPAGWVETRRYAAPSARQAVAVGEKHFYSIGNHWIEKYEKSSGYLIGEWRGADDGPIVHLNSGILIDGELWCAHSNYPGVPMASSIERFDARTLEHVGSHSFGILQGSATWVDRHDGAFWVAFAHYGAMGGGGGKKGGEPGKGPEWTSLVRFDDDWRRTGGWVYPKELVLRFAPSSNSGGVFGPDGLLYVTGHDHNEVYVLRLPRAGSVLEWVSTLPAPFVGQGISLDESDPGALWGIIKQSRDVVVGHRTAPHD
jgi:hypothetical protein